MIAALTVRRAFDKSLLWPFVLLGARLYTGISEAAFRELVLGLLILSGVAMLASAVPALLQRRVIGAAPARTAGSPSPAR